MFSFPDAPTIRTHLLNSPSLNSTPYFKEKGIDKAVSDLAAERFANSELVEIGVKMGVMLVLNDLQTGKDGYSGKPLPKFDLPGMFWNILQVSLEKDIKKCAKVEVQSKV